ncbi:MAG TPA: formate dehydrogenase accessory sulfurtransferase FdhD [Syntrophomonas sp.]|nr:formate dehydrogenase accessory sulfurtransferase FdhD [Syntrophomonas sp.]
MNCKWNEETVQTRVLKINGSNAEITDEQIAVEKALTVYLNDKEFVTLVCSPGQENELVIGFLYMEGIINNLGQLAKISVNCQEGIAWVETTGEGLLAETLFLKRYLTSCCGKGRSSFYYANDARLTKKIDSSLKVTSQDISYYIDLLDVYSELFRLTGGVHGGGIAAEGQLHYFASDIGRHNVIDKLYGQALMDKIDFSDKIIVFSGRISSEILIKTAKIGCPVLVGVSAPTDLALELAEELGITVIGFAREGRMNVYTHEERVIISEKLSFSIGEKMLDVFSDG